MKSIKNTSIEKPRDNMFDLRGKKVLVTGSTQGIGYAIARCLAKQGAKVFVHGSSSMEKCQGVAGQIPGAIPIVENLANDNCAKNLHEKTGDVDILVLNASVQYLRAWSEITSEEFDIQVRVNFKSSLELIQRYTPYMQKQNWGRIVTVGSVQQYRPHTHMAVYAATKSAQMNMVTNFARQLAPFGITVNNMAPGVIATPRNEHALSDKEYAKQVAKKIPCGFPGTAEDCVGGVLLLCSDEGRYITGVDFIIDGGMHL